MQKRNNVEISDEDAIEYDRLMELASDYDRKQHVKKILLNSAYGCLGSIYFRFFDIRLCSSTTATGQELLRHQTAKVNELLTGEYDFEGEAIIAGDTDSVVGDTRIYVNGVEDTIENVFNSLDTKKIVGDKEYSTTLGDLNVLSYDPINSNPVYDQAHCVYRRKVYKPQWAIDDENGNVVVMSGDHSIMIERNGELMEEFPRDIMGDDIIISLSE